jgi:hypothetical protein
MNQRATAPTRLRMTYQHRGKARELQSNRSMGLKNEKSSMVVL